MLIQVRILSAAADCCGQPPIWCSEASRFSPKSASGRPPANHDEGLANPKPRETLDGPTTSTSTSKKHLLLCAHLPSPQFPSPPLLVSRCFFFFSLVDFLDWRAFFFIMLGRNVLRSVPSRGLARQFLNRASTVRIPPQQTPNPLDLGGLELCVAIGGEGCFQLIFGLTIHTACLFLDRRCRILSLLPHSHCLRRNRCDDRICRVSLWSRSFCYDPC